MASASFVEIISHFAGYLQIFHDIARDRIQYDESLAPRPSGDYTTLRPNYDYRIVPEDMETVAGPVPELMPDDPIHFVRGRPLKLLRGPQDDDSDFFPRSPAPSVAAAETAGRRWRRRRRRLSRHGEIPGWWPGDPTDGSSIQLHA